MPESQPAPAVAKAAPHPPATGHGRARAVALSAEARRWALAAGALCALPLMLHLPQPLVLGLLGVGLLSAWTSRRPWPALLRLLITVALVGAVLAWFGFQIGRDTGSALLLAMMAVKPGELRTRRDAYSLLGFAIFSPFAALLQDQGPLTLGLSVAAAAMVFATANRLAEDDGGARPEGRPLQRIRHSLLWLLLAVPLTAPAFLLFPRLGEPLWGMPENAQARTGIGDRMSPGDWLDLFVDDSPAFRVGFAGPIPPNDSLYWRGLVLWDFDGRTWTRPYWAQGVSPAPFTTRQTPLRYQLTLEPSERPFLFALDLPVELPAGTTAGIDYSLMANAPVRTLRRLELASSAPASFEPELSPIRRGAALRLPEGFNPRAIELARRWRAEARSDEEIVQRALALFRAEFSYSLSAPPLGRHSVDEFLFSTRVGFCEHFSSAFGFLMRAAGVPSRVVLGYVGGYRNPFGDYLLVRQSDAHAWNEVWLEGRGWVRVDPTAAVDPARVFDRAGIGRTGGGLLGGLSGLGDRFAPLRNAIDWGRRAWNEVLLGYDAARQRLMLRPFGIEQADTLQLSVAFALALALGLLLVVAILLRGERRNEDPALRAYRRLLRRLRRAGLAKPAQEPPLSFGQRAATAFPDQADTLLALSHRFSDWRYAPEELDDTEKRALIRDLDAFHPRRRARSFPGGLS